MIFLRTYAFDNSSTGENVTAVCPVGVRDGDLLIAAVAYVTDTWAVVRSARPTPAPPDDSWTVLFDSGERRTDTQGAGNGRRALAVFYKAAQNEPERYTFTRASSGSSVESVGVVAYAGVDVLDPFETTVDAKSSTIQIPSVVCAEPGGEILVCASVFTGESAVLSAATTNYTVVGESGAGPQNNAVMFARRSCSRPEFLSELDVVGTVGRCTLSIVLRPAASAVSVDDVAERLLAGFPRGVERVYDLTAGGDYGRLFSAIASGLKAMAFDVVAALRREMAPLRSRYRLFDWESLLGIQNTDIARRSGVPRRRAALRAALYAAAATDGPTDAVVRSVMAPLLVADPSTLEVLEVDREELETRHTHGFGVDVTVTDNQIAIIQIDVPHGGYIQSGDTGPILELVFDPDEFGNALPSGAVVPGNTLAVTLRAPNGEHRTWTVDATRKPPNPIVYRADWTSSEPVSVRGPWRVEIYKAAAGTLTAKATSALFVEGTALESGQTQETAAAVFHWGVRATDYNEPPISPGVYDPERVDVRRGASLLDVSLAAARLFLAKLTTAHTKSTILRDFDALPSFVTSIPDQMIPK